MALPLTPIEIYGGTDLLLYEERDIFGAEAPSQLLADTTGYNEICRWSRDAELALTAEHFANGVHHTFKIPKAALFVKWNGAAPVCTDQSYVQDSSGNIKRGTAACSWAAAGTGQYIGTLGYAMANSAYQVISSIGSALHTVQNAGPPTSTSILYYRAAAWLYTITSTTVFEVVRKEWVTSAFNTAALADGDFTIYVFSST